MKMNTIRLLLALSIATLPFCLGAQNTLYPDNTAGRAESCRTIAVFGGSLSVNKESDAAKQIWADRLGATVTTYGVGGAGFSSLQGHTLQQQVREAGVYDIYVLWASTNDYNNDRECGKWTDYTEFDGFDERKLVTQCGGINYCIKTLLEKNPKAEIYFFTSLRFFSKEDGYNPYSTKKNRTGKNFAQYVEAQKQCCLHYGIPVLDQFSLQGVNIFNYSEYYMPDKLHMNEDGYRKIGYRQAEFLSTGLPSVNESHSGPRISIFADHIRTVATQRKTSFTEAARAIREIGYEGVDVRVNQDPAELRILDSLGFAHSCAIADIDYCSGADVSAQEDQALEFMRRYGYDRILIVPGLLGDTGRTDVTTRLGAFAERAAREGRIVMVENYDNHRSPCFNTVLLSRMFEEAPYLRHNFDSGNYLMAGEDCLEAIRLLRGRISHVHLKDRVSKSDMSCPAIGAGCIPEAEVIRILRDSGYSGWLTVEHFGARDMLKAATESFGFVAACLASK